MIFGDISRVVFLSLGSAAPKEPPAWCVRHAASHAWRSPTHGACEGRQRGWTYQTRGDLPSWGQDRAAQEPPGSAAPAPVQDIPLPSPQAPALCGQSMAKHTGTQLATASPLMRGLSRTLPGLERTRSSTLCPLRCCRLAVANEQGWTHHKTALLTTQGSSKSTLYCPLPVQFTPNPAPCSWLGARPPPAAHEMGGKAGSWQRSGVQHVPAQARHAVGVTPSSQEHAGTPPWGSPRHAAISTALRRSPEEPVGPPGLCPLVRSQGSPHHRTMHPVPCVSLSQEITKGSAFLPPKKAPRKKRGRRFPENLSVKV